jgi:hypothetical protein
MVGYDNKTDQITNSFTDSIILLKFYLECCCVDGSSTSILYYNNMQRKIFPG